MLACYGLRRIQYFLVGWLYASSMVYSCKMDPGFLLSLQNGDFDGFDLWSLMLWQWIQFSQRQVLSVVSVLRTQRSIQKLRLLGDASQKHHTLLEEGARGAETHSNVETLPGRNKILER